MSSIKKSITLTATSLRVILSVAFILMLTGSGVLVYFGLQVLRGEAADTRAIVSQADQISQTNSRTAQLWKTLQQEQDIVDKADRVVAESQSYQYQDVIIQDINAFARRAGVSVLSYDFTAPAAATTATPATTNETATSDSPADTTATTPTSSLKTTSVNVAIATPVTYRNLLNFLHYIEQNLTRMQIASVSLGSAGADSGPSAVTSNSLTIEVYIR